MARNLNLLTAHHLRTIGGGLIGFLLAGVTLSQTPIPSGPQFQVNTNTDYNQFVSSVASTPDGGFIVSWSSYTQTGPGLSAATMKFQRYDRDGFQAGGETEVDPNWSYGAPVVAVGSGGDFVVVWEDFYNYPPNIDLAGQRYSADGITVGAKFQLNSLAGGIAVNGDVGVTPAGQFVVVWQSYLSAGSDTSRFSIQARRFESDGNPIGDQFQVNTYTTDMQQFPKIAIGSGGEFVVAWSSDPTYVPDPLALPRQGSMPLGLPPDGDRDGRSIRARRYAPNGSAIGDEFRVNTITQYNQDRPDIDVDSTGNFVVVWESEAYSAPDLEPASVQAQRFDANGIFVGAELQINAYTTSGQYGPSVSFVDDGNFVVVWDSSGSFGSDSSYLSIQGRVILSDGSPSGGEFQVNSYTTNSQSQAVVATRPGNEFMVAWLSNGSPGPDNSGFSVQAQRFGPSEIFADGFQSGDTSAWSSTVP